MEQKEISVFTDSPWSKVRKVKFTIHEKNGLLGPFCEIAVGKASGDFRRNWNEIGQLDRLIGTLQFDLEDHDSSGPLRRLKEIQLKKLTIPIETDAALEYRFASGVGVNLQFFVTGFGYRILILRPNPRIRAPVLMCEKKAVGVRLAVMFDPDSRPAGLSRHLIQVLLGNAEMSQFQAPEQIFFCESRGYQKPPFDLFVVSDHRTPFVCVLMIF
ncbi:MAG: hypothetical protein KGI60_01070 [Patescibacteria group bacterium]|nr:hypothetical protein [Patescibacteria group bacterium]